MKILMINVCCGTGSTGRICTDLADVLIASGHDVKIAYGRDSVPEKYKTISYKIGSKMDVYLHALQSRIFDNSGFVSKNVTKEFVEWIQEYDPDVIHLHNIHGYYINVEILFNYLKKCGKKILWTLHDCWSFTGHCAYFDYANCSKWKTGCKGMCPNKKDYPKCSLISNNEQNYEKKKAAFVGVNNLTIICPSIWLKGLVEQSYLSEYPIYVIHNGIDTSVFTKMNSDFKVKYNLVNKKIVLGVASPWSQRKGLPDFLEIAKKLPDNYKVVLVGLDDKQLSVLPKSIIGIKRTADVKELASIYSAAHFFVNLTYEDNYPTTNLEAQACGTPVITYKTGGSVESCVECYVVNKGDINSVVDIICNDKNKYITEIEMSKSDMVNNYKRLITNI